MLRHDVDIRAAERFVLANGRLLDRHRLAVLLHDAPTAPVLGALRAYRNRDGGFGHALEPDVRAPESEPASTLHALEVLAEIDALDDPMVADGAAWIASIAGPDSRRAVRPPERGRLSACAVDGRLGWRLVSHLGHHRAVVGNELA